MAGTIDNVFLMGHLLFNSDFAGLIASIGPLAQAESGGWAGALVQTFWLWARVALGIGFVVFVHELGHFLAAKWCGVKVEKFYVGFDVPISIGPIKLPRTLGRFRYGETEYGIGTIPLGGYVKMLGQDDDPRNAEAEAKRIRNASDAPEEAGEPAAVTLDPRSFPAKPVWQRMIIISAGVVLNLITGVMFAGLAFMIGVPYVPAVIGDVAPGSPAYQAGIQPGGKVIGVGSIARDEQLHFREMRLAILTEGMDSPTEPVNVSIEYPSGVKEYQLMTAPGPDDPSQRIIGIMTPPATRLSDVEVATPDSVASEALTDKDKGAKVLAFDGTKLPGDGADDNVEASLALTQYLQANVAKPVTLSLKRTDDSNVEVTIPPQMMKEPGIRFAIGPVSALVEDGVAAKAGVKVGDRLVAVDGNQDIDAFSLPTQLAAATEPIKMSFKRGVAEAEETIEMTIAPSAGSRSMPPVSESDNSIALDRFQFTYEATPVVIKADAIEGDTESSKQVADSSHEQIQAGDEIKKVAVRWQGGKVPAIFEESYMKEERDTLSEGWELSSRRPLSALMYRLQLLPAGTDLVVVVSRQDKMVEAKSKVTLTDVAWGERGIRFKGIERMQVASSIGEATSLGIREGKRRLGDVFGFLKMLVQGKVQSKQVGGPIMIFQAAGSETSRGTSSLLMFLTLLSMNLAILNFLPIPALDGGHMVFLTAEAVMGRPVNEKLQMQLTMAGVLALLSLMLFAFYNDISRLL